MEENKIMGMEGVGEGSEVRGVWLSVEWKEGRGFWGIRKIMRVDIIE